MDGIAIYLVNLNHWSQYHSPSTRTQQVLNDPSSDPSFIRLFEKQPEVDQQRIQRYAFVHDALRTLLGTALIRKVLQLTSGSDTGFISIGRTSQNKPYWSEDGSKGLDESQKRILRQISFNLSHHNNWIMLAVSTHGTVGCDIASVRVPGRPIPIDEYLSLMSSAMGLSEKSFIMDTSATSQTRLNRQMMNWALKEAYVKMLGEGLSFEAHKIEFPLSQDEAKTAAEGAKLNVLLPLSIDDISPRDMISHSPCQGHVVPIHELASKDVSQTSTGSYLQSFFTGFTKYLGGTPITVKSEQSGHVGSLDPGLWTACDVSLVENAESGMCHYFLKQEQSISNDSSPPDFEVLQWYLNPSIANSHLRTSGDIQIENEKKGSRNSESLEIKGEPTVAAVIRSLKYKILANEEREKYVDFPSSEVVNLELVTEKLLSKSSMDGSHQLPRYLTLIHPNSIL